MVENVWNAEDDTADDRHLHVEKQLSERLEVLEMDGLLRRSETAIQSENRTKENRIHEPIDEHPAHDRSNNNTDRRFDDAPAEFLEMVEERHLAGGARHGWSGVAP